MSISGLGAQSAFAIQQLVSMRAQFNDLQRQLSTGQKSSTYAGLGLDRGLTVSLNAQLSAIDAYGDTIDNVMSRVNLMNTTLNRMVDIGSAIKAVMVQANTTGNSSGAYTAQSSAKVSLDELLGLLNAQAGDRYLFSGRMTDTPAAETMEHILNGDGGRAGLQQLIAERKAADLGAGGLGRLSIANGGTSVSLTEDAGLFGFKLASVNSTVANSTASGPIGSPATLSVNFTGVPSAGETITVRFTLPDGSSENLTLTATTNAPPGANEFTIGGTAAASAANFESALNASLGTLAATSLTASSAVQASNEFFDGDAGNPPLRVDGPPFDTATGMVAGTTANTVIWYTGETGTDPARGTAVARIDQSLSVSYGARGNEPGLRAMVQSVATLAAITVSSSDPNASALSRALNQRVAGGMSGGSQSITDVQAELASAQGSMVAAKSRHQQTTAMLSDFLQQIAGVSNEEVGSKILALQTRMQASMQTTAMLFQTSLVNYL
ncbi:MAG: flagellar biosynthesis protein FlgL [Pseudolabrys sp.]